MACKITINDLISVINNTEVVTKDKQALWNMLKNNVGVGSVFHAKKGVNNLAEYVNNKTTDISIESSILDMIDSFVSSSELDLNPNWDKTMLNPHDTTSETVQGWQSVISYFISHTTKKVQQYSKQGLPRGTTKSVVTRSLDSKVANAVALATNEWLVNNGIQSTAINRADDTFRAMFGVDKKSPVTIFMREQTAGIDALVGPASNAIGNTAYKMLGLTANENTEFVNNEQIAQSFKTELGLLGLKAMESAGVLKLTRDVKYKLQPGNRAPTMLVNAIKFADVNVVQNEGEVLANSIGVAGNIIQNVNSIGTHLTDAINGIVASDSIRGIYLDRESAVPKREDIVNDGATGIVSDVSKAHKDAVERQSSTPMTFKEGFVLGIQALSNSLNRYLGEVGEEGVLSVRKASVRGKNLMVDTVVGHLTEAYDKVKYNPMYAKWKVITNNRFMIDSNELNWQDKKLHRNAVYAKKVLVDVANPEQAELFNNFRMMLAQSFDVDIDKQTPQKSLKEVQDIIEEVLNLPGLSGAIVETVNENETLKEYYNSKVFSEDVLLVTDHIINKYNSGEPEHAISGVVELLGYLHEVNRGREYATESRIETDAITSGYAIKSLMFPFNAESIDGVFKELKKVGVYKLDENGEPDHYGNWKEQDGNEDSYEEPARELSKLLVNEDVNVLRLVDPKSKSNKGVISISRAFMKNPFMVLNYGSSTKSIVSAIARTAEENFYLRVEPFILGTETTNKALDGLEEALIDVFKRPRRNAQKAVSKTKNAQATAIATKVLNSTITDVQAVAYAKNIMRNIHEAEAITSEQDGKVERFKLTSAESKAFNEGVESVIGSPLTTVFQMKYKAFMSLTRTTNSVLTMQFRIAKIQMDQKIEELYNENLAKVGGNKRMVPPITTEELYTIIQDLGDVFPTLGTALDTDKGNNAKILIAKMQRMSGQNRKGNVTTSGTIRTNSKVIDKVDTAAIEIYELVESYSSGAVLPIHFFDASVQAKVLSEMEALGVHDANYFTIDEVVKGTSLYNKHFWDLAKKYSLAKEIYESLVKSLATIDDNTNIDLEEATDLYINIKNTYINAENNREQLFNTPVSVQQAYYATVDKNGDTVVADYKPDVSEKYKKLEIDVSPETIKKVEDMLLVSIGSHDSESSMANDAKMLVKEADNNEGC